MRFTRINCDSNGNPRYVVHFLDVAKTYEDAIRLCKPLGGRKFHNKQYGGGIVFTSYNTDRLEQFKKGQLMKTMYKLTYEGVFNTWERYSSKRETLEVLACGAGIAKRGATITKLKRKPKNLKKVYGDIYQLASK